MNSIAAQVILIFHGLEQFTLFKNREAVYKALTVPTHITLV